MTFSGGDRKNRMYVVTDRIHRFILDFFHSVLVLKRRVTCTSFVSPICLPHERDPHDLYENRQAVAIGWGTINPDTGDMPSKLQHVDVKTLSNDNCGYYDFDLLSENMLCAGEEGKDTCYGDSGGN